MTDATAGNTGDTADEVFSGRDPGRHTGPPDTGLQLRGETAEQKYLRHIRTSVVCIAVVMTISALAVVAWSIYVWVQISSVSDQLGNLQQQVPSITNGSCFEQTGSPGLNC